MEPAPLLRLRSAIVSYNSEACKLKTSANKSVVKNVCNKSNVFQIEVDVALDKLRVKSLMKKFPNSWEDRYRIEANNCKVCELVIQELRGETWSRPSTLVKPTVKFLNDGKETPLVV